jgi:AAA domain
VTIQNIASASGDVNTHLQNVAPATNIDNPQPDPQAVAAHVRMLHHIAQLAIDDGAPADSILPLCGFRDDYPAIVRHFRVGDLDANIAAAIEIARTHNVYQPLALMRPDLAPGAKGGESDLVAVLGFVVDGDADHGRAAPKPPVAADVVIESSPGNYQHLILLYEPLTNIPYAKHTGQALKRMTLADCADDLSHVWRVAGTLWYPTKGKTERGRPSTPQAVRIVKPWDDGLTDIGDLRIALKNHLGVHPPEPKTPRPAAVDNDVCPKKAEALLTRLKNVGWFDRGPYERDRYIDATKACAYDLGDDPGFAIWRRTVCWQGDRPEQGRTVDDVEAETRWWGDCANLRKGVSPKTFGTVIADAERVLGWTRGSMYIRRDKTADKMFSTLFPNAAPLPTAVESPSIAPEQQPQPMPTNLLLSSAAFVADFVSPEYLVDGIIIRRFAYCLTAQTGTGKTAICLLLAAHVALGRSLNGLEIERGSVLYFAGENPTDIQMRWLAMSEALGFSVDDIDVHFVSGAMPLSKIADRITQEVKDKNLNLALVIVDTSAAYFEGTDENAPTELLVHARRMRSLVNLPGGPSVVVACHPTKNANEEALEPRGGSTFIAELDGNLTARRKDGSISMHWHKKLRAVGDFTPLLFKLETGAHPRLIDKKGRPVKTVIARPLDDAAASATAEQHRSNEDKVLKMLCDHPGASLADVAAKLGWRYGKKNEPYKQKVSAAVKVLTKDKLVVEVRGMVTVTPKGQQYLNKLDDALRAKWNPPEGAPIYPMPSGQALN